MSDNAPTLSPADKAPPQEPVQLPSPQSMGVFHHLYKAVEASFISITQGITFITTIITTFFCAICSSGIGKTVTTAYIVGSAGPRIAYRMIHHTMAFTSTSLFSAASLLGRVPNIAFKICQSAWMLMLDMPALIKEVSLSLPSTLLSLGMQAVIDVHDMIAPHAALPPFSTAIEAAMLSYQKISKLAHLAGAKVSSHPFTVYVANTAWAGLWPLHPYVPKVMTDAVLFQELQDYIRKSAYMMICGFSAAFLANIVAFMPVCLLLMTPFILAIVLVVLLSLVATVSIVAVPAVIFLGMVLMVVLPALGLLLMASYVSVYVHSWVSPKGLAESGKNVLKQGGLNV